MPYELPLTASDLQVIAAALEPIEDNVHIVTSPVIGRIEVYRPDGDDVIGYFQSAGMGEDDWYGFIPATSTAEGETK
jgi:hypothetical protein